MLPQLIKLILVLLKHPEPWASALCCAPGLGRPCLGKIWLAIGCITNREWGGRCLKHWFYLAQSSWTCCPLLSALSQSGQTQVKPTKFRIKSDPQSASTWFLRTEINFSALTKNSGSVNQKWVPATIRNGKRRWKQKLSPSSQWYRGPLTIRTSMINGDLSLNTELLLTGKGCGENMGLHECLILQLYRISALLVCPLLISPSSYRLSRHVKHCCQRDACWGGLGGNGRGKSREIICEKVFSFLRDWAYSRSVLYVYGWWVVVGQSAFVSWDRRAGVLGRMLRAVWWGVVATSVCAGGAAGLGMCVWMHMCTAISASFSLTLKYLEALCLTALKSFSHLSSQSSEDYHFSTIALFGSKTKSSSTSCSFTCPHLYKPPDIFWALQSYENAFHLSHPMCDSLCSAYVS